jgi:hypothetical protein
MLFHFQIAFGERGVVYYRFKPIIAVANGILDFLRHPLPDDDIIHLGVAVTL